jgi:DNA-binding XRE family transcriptional regulator
MHFLYIYRIHNHFQHQKERFAALFDVFLKKYVLRKGSTMHLGSIVKERRKLLNITQETLAEMSGVGLRTLKQLESGKGNPTIITLEKVADVLGMQLVLQIKSMDQ